MSTTLSEITKRYARTIKDISGCLGLLDESIPNAAVLATHYFLQLEHLVKNALLEIKHLPNRKEG